VDGCSGDAIWDNARRTALRTMQLYRSSFSRHFISVSNLACTASAHCSGARRITAAHAQGEGRWTGRAPQPQRGVTTMLRW